ncbi:hypothetical protein FSP39_012096, partial [Pinctada imbricata]
LAESFPVSEFGVAQILKSKIKMRTKEDVNIHDMKVKKRWDLLPKIIGKTDDDPLIPTLNMLMENKKFLQLENANGNSNLPFPSLPELPREDELSTINSNSMRLEAGMFESYLMRMSEKTQVSKSSICHGSRQDKRLPGMKEGLKMLTGSLMEEAAKKGLNNETYKRKLGKQGQSALTNTKETHNTNKKETHNINFDTSQKEMIGRGSLKQGVSDARRYQTIDAAFDLDDSKDFAKPTQRRDPTSKKTNSIEKNISHQELVGEESPKQVVRKVTKYKALSAAFGLDDNEDFAKPTQRGEITSKRPDTTKDLATKSLKSQTLDTTMELLSIQDNSTLSDSTSKSYTSLNSNYQGSPVENSRQPRTPDSEKAISVNQPDAHVEVKADKLMDIDDNLVNTLMREQVMNDKDVALRRRQRKRIEKLKDDWNTSSPHFYEKLQMHETFMIQIPTMNATSSTRNDHYSESNKVFERKIDFNTSENCNFTSGKQPTFQNRLSSNWDRNFREDEYYDGKKQKEFSAYGNRKIKSAEQRDFEEKLSYENIITAGKRGSDKQHIVKHPYYYDPVTGYQNPYGKFVKEDRVRWKRQDNMKKGKYYKKDDTVYDSDGEILFKVPKS